MSESPTKERITIVIEIESGTKVKTVTVEAEKEQIPFATEDYYSADWDGN